MGVVGPTSTASEGEQGRSGEQRERYSRNSEWPLNGAGDLCRILRGRPLLSRDVNRCGTCLLSATISVRLDASAAWTAFIAFELFKLDSVAVLVRTAAT